MDEGEVSVRSSSDGIVRTDSQVEGVVGNQPATIPTSGRGLS